jgi:hypothetical protein
MAAPPPAIGEPAASLDQWETCTHVKLYIGYVFILIDLGALRGYASKPRFMFKNEKHRARKNWKKRRREFLSWVMMLGFCFNNLKFFHRKEANTTFSGIVNAATSGEML